ncbi:MAG: hypothetical protein OEW75_00390 [Cyclobacteriaceae bacterium]|nr:hypothetical protein [Cyclobacteriaceae bacterium]
MKPLFSSTVTIFIILYLSGWGEFDTYPPTNQQNLADTTIFVDFYDVEIIDTISISESSWVLFSGYPTDNLESNIALYIIKSDVDLHAGESVKFYSYPSKVYDYEDKSLIYECNVYIGNCLSKYEKSIVWVQNELGDDGKFHQSIFTVNFTESGIEEFLSEYNSGTIQQIEDLVELGFCKMLPQVDLTSEP